MAFESCEGVLAFLRAARCHAFFCVMQLVVEVKNGYVSQPLHQFYDQSDGKKREQRQA